MNESMKKYVQLDVKFTEEMVEKFKTDWREKWREEFLKTPLMVIPCEKTEIIDISDGLIRALTERIIELENELKEFKTIWED